MKLELVLKKELLQPGCELAPEDATQRGDGQEESSRGGDPSGTVGCKTASRNNVVYVRMMVKVLSPSVEHAKKPDVRTRLATTSSHSYASMTDPSDGKATATEFIYMQDSLGDIWRQNGELDKADTAYQQAEVIARKIEDKNATAYVLNGMGDVAFDRGDLALARKRYEEALALRNQAGEKQSAAESRVSLARLAIEEGRAPDAEASVRACIEQFQKEQQADDELTARIVLIDALLAQAKLSEAQKEMQAAQPLGNKSQNRFLRLQFELASGRVLLASDHPDASRPLFQGVAGDAHRYGFVGIEFADNLALAEFANKTKHISQAQMELRALQKSASSKGFGLIARKASRESSDLRKSIGAM